MRKNFNVLTLFTCLLVAVFCKNEKKKQKKNDSKQTMENICTWEYQGQKEDFSKWHRLLTGKYVNQQAQESSGIEREEYVSISEVEMKHKFIDVVHLKDGNGNEISLCLEELGRFSIHVSHSSTGFSTR